MTEEIKTEISTDCSYYKDVVKNEILIDGAFDVSKGNQKYAEKYSPVEDWYKAENNMLDGINVAECVHFTRQYNHGYCELSNDSCNEFQYNCAKNKNCYYKQLKRLEQENKELKDKITALEDKLQLRMASDKESDAFWDEIFSAEDYPFNKENAYKELRDYYFVLEQLPKIYMEITGGTLSKTTYFASSVVEAYNDALDRYYDKIDDLEYNNNTYRSALEEIKAILDKECGVIANAKAVGIINEVLTP